MTQSAGGERGTATADVLGAAMRGGDLTAIAGLLAGDVTWQGAHGGACHTRDEVLAVLREQRDRGVTATPVDLLLVGDRLLLRAELSSEDGPVGGGRIPWIVVATLDPAGRIVHLQDYTEIAAARRDLTVRADAAVGGASREPAPPATRVSGLVPFVHVADVERSVAFYRLLGFEVQDTYEPAGRLSWASLRSVEAALMLARREEPVDAAAQAVLFYLYTRDLAGLRDHLVAQGALVGEILDGTPGPRAEMRITDPDGYCLMVALIED